MTFKERTALLLKRLAAYFIDCILVFTFYLITQTTVLKLVRDSISADNEWMKVGLYSEIYTLLTISLPVWFYFSLMDSSKLMGTVGKKILRLKVLKDGSRLSFLQSFCRTILKLLPWELTHIANNFPVPMYFIEQPELRVGFIISAIIILIYIASILVDNKARSIYDLITNVRVLPRNGHL